MMNIFNYTKEKAENIYFEIQSITSDSEANSWIAPLAGLRRDNKLQQEDRDISYAVMDLQVNLSSYDVFGNLSKRHSKAKSVAFMTEKGMIRKKNNGTTIDFGLQ